MKLIFPSILLLISCGKAVDKKAEEKKSEVQTPKTAVVSKSKVIMHLHYGTCCECYINHLQKVPTKDHKTRLPIVIQAPMENVDEEICGKVCNDFAKAL